MIAPFGKHLRKWLLAVAVAVRNRVQAIVAGLESAEEEQTKTARAGGPPDHWVQLVERHAPELLQPGPLSVAARTRSSVFEDDAELDASAPEDIRDLKPTSGALDDSDAPTQEDLSFSSPLPQAPKEDDLLVSKRQTPTQVARRQPGDTFRSTGVAATPPKHHRDDVALYAEEPAPACEEKRTSTKTLSRKRDEKPAPLQDQTDKIREAETANSRPSAERLSQTPNGLIEKTRAGDEDTKNIPVVEQSARHGEQVHRDKPEYEAGSQPDTHRPVQRELKQKGGNETLTELDEASKGMASAQDTRDIMSAPQIPVSKESAGPVKEARIINGQRTAYPPQDREKVTKKTLPPTELSWPSLPGENDAEDIRDAHLTATWPGLPEDRAPGVGPPSPQLGPHPTEAESRKSEHLQRLEEEQKG